MRCPSGTLVAWHCGSQCVRVCVLGWVGCVAGVGRFPRRGALRLCVCVRRGHGIWEEAARALSLSLPLRCSCPPRRA